MTSKPPLRGRIISLCAAELWVDAAIIAKVVFTWDRTRLCIKLAAGGSAVSMQEIAVGDLPEGHRDMYSNVSSNVDVLYLLADSTPNEIDDIEVFDAATDIVSEVDAMLRIATCCSPVTGMTLQRGHSCQTQAVHIPIVGVLIHWGVDLQDSFTEGRKHAARVAPGHD